MSIPQEPVTITVTQEDIDKGLQGCPYHCAIAEAAKRVGWDSVEVGDRAFIGNIEGRTWRAILPNEARDFIQTFDGGFPVQPMSFKLCLY